MPAPDDVRQAVKEEIRWRASTTTGSYDECIAQSAYAYYLAMLEMESKRLDLAVQIMQSHLWIPREGRVVSEPNGRTWRITRQGDYFAAHPIEKG